MRRDGAIPEEVETLVAAMRGIPALHLRGLMAIPPVGTTEEARRWFRELRALRDRLALEQLSMGMSEDFETAIEEGSTMVRVGRAIFGARG